MGERKIGLGRGRKRENGWKKEENRENSEGQREVILIEKKKKERKKEEVRNIKILFFISFKL